MLSAQSPLLVNTTHYLAKSNTTSSMIFCWIGATGMQPLWRRSCAAAWKPGLPQTGHVYITDKLTADKWGLTHECSRIVGVTSWPSHLSEQTHVSLLVKEAELRTLPVSLLLLKCNAYGWWHHLLWFSAEELEHDWCFCTGGSLRWRSWTRWTQCLGVHLMGDDEWSAACCDSSQETWKWREPLTFKYQKKKGPFLSATVACTGFKKHSQAFLKNRFRFNSNKSFGKVCLMKRDKKKGFKTVSDF